MLKRIAPGDVRLGMYIHSFDGRWLAHPFWRSQFHITDADDLRRVQMSKVRAVIIDAAKSLSSAAPDAAAVPSCVANDRVPDRVSRPGAASRRQPSPSGRRPMFTRPVPPDPALPPSASAERADIVRVLSDSARAVKQVFDGVSRGDHISLVAFARVVDDLSAAMAQNRTLMIGISRLKKKDEYTFSHSVAVGALMLNLGRELGLDEDVVRDLALGGLVHDVGKMAIPHAILNKPGPLTDAEFAEMRRHPELGHSILTTDETVSPTVLDVALRHHERLDGKGYPGGLAGDELSLPVRIAGICDVFDALTSARIYKEAMLAHEAMAMMAGWEGQFDPDLLLAFMRSVGSYPPGMLVRLSSQRLAVMLPPGRHAGRPRARAFHCAAGDVPLPPCDVVISENGVGESIVAAARPGDWSIGDWPALRDRLLDVTAQRAA